MLARAGFEVRAVGSTATELATGSGAGCLKQLGIDVSGRTELHYSHRGVRYRLLEVGDRRPNQWETEYGQEFDRIFGDELSAFRPDVLLGFGGSPGVVDRFSRARHGGARLVFGLRNGAYLAAKGFLSEMDAILTPSQYLSDFYRDRIGLKSTALPTPVDLDDFVSDTHDPVFFTMINPSPEKGLMLLARLAAG